jgi:O-antigen/teichoic acid export membrane protein
MFHAPLTEGRAGAAHDPAEPIRTMRLQFLLSLIANVSRVLLGFVFFWQVSQALGLKTLGEYLYVTAALGYFGTLIDYGFNLFVLNTASRSAGSVRPLFLRVVVSKLVLTALSVLILVGLYAIAFTAQGLVVTALFFAIMALQSFSGLLIQFFKALGRFEHEFSSAILASALPVAAVWVWADSLTLPQLAWIVLAIRLVVLAFQACVFLRLTRGQTWAALDEAIERLLPRALRDIRANFKYALFSVLGAVFLSVDLVVMRFVLGPEDVTIYGTAMKVILAGILFFEVLNGTFTPRLARAHTKGDGAMNKEASRFITIMGITAVVFSSAIFLFAPAAISVAFGPEYAGAADLVRVLSVILLLRVSEMTIGPLLTVYGLQGFRARVMTIVLPVHITLNLALQPQFGIRGAVASLALSFLLLFILNTVYLLRHRDRCTMAPSDRALTGAMPSGPTVPSP